MKKISAFALIGFLCFVLFSCQSKPEKEVKEIYLKKEVEMNLLSDSTFMYDVRSVDLENDKIYFTDYNRNEVIVLDENFNLLNTIGGEGRGPGEFVGAYVLKVSGDSILVANDAKRAIEIFEDDKHLKTIKLNDAFLAGGTRFAQLEDNLYFSIMQGGENIAIYRKGRIIETFGKSKEYPTEAASILRNEKHILSSDDRIIAVSNSRTTVELYDAEGKFISDFNYKKVPVVSQTMEFVEKQETSENSFYVIASDASVHADKLYILIYTNVPERLPASNTVLEIDMANEELQVTGIFHLGGEWFQSFSVGDDFLVASTGDKLIKYNLSR